MIRRKERRRTTMTLTSKAFMLFIISVAVLGLSVVNGHAATIPLSNYGDGTCSLANAQVAYNAASAGDIIVFPAGSCIWSSALTIRKPLSIIGAGYGVGGTKLIASGVMTNGFFNVTGFTSTDKIVRISGFFFEMGNFTTKYGIIINNVTLDKLRIDNNRFNYGSYQIEVGGSKGVIDSNYFYNGNKGVSYTAGSTDQANESWEALVAGTSGALFIEDNHFIDDADFTATYSNERIGTYNGGKLVIRYNHFDSSNFPLSSTIDPIMTHGSAAGGVANGYWQIGTGARRAQSVVEIYNNLMEGKRIDFPVIARGASNLIYNNVIKTTGGSTRRILLREEEYSESTNWEPLRVNWPAEDQVHNTFIWNNTDNGVQMTSTNIITVPDETKIQLNRDYFLHEPQATGGRETFVCKNGITKCNGSSNTYPTDGVKYATIGTMVFSPDGPNAFYPYTPYIYPHPLRNTPNPPLNLR